jgi:hypothetical protein
MKHRPFLSSVFATFFTITAIPAPAQDSASPKADELTALKAEVERLKGMAPDQSHAMKDVAYHFANLWFAADKKNWPLADFYLSETRSHLRWAVRIIPVRKTPEGQEVRLEELLKGVDEGVLKPLADTVKAADGKAFRERYETALAACYGCHVTVGKPFLRLRIPTQPEVPIINFDPQ